MKYSIDEYNKPNLEPENSIQIAQIEYISKNLGASTIINLMSGVALVIYLRNQVPQTNLIVWFGLIMLVTILRIFLVNQFSGLTLKNKSEKLKSYSVVLFFSGSAWGLAPWLIFPDNSITSQAILAMTLIFFISISAVTLCGSFKDILNYTSSLTVPFVAKYFYIGTSETYLIAILTLLFFGITLVNAHKISNSLSSHYNLQKQLGNQSDHLKNVERELTTIFDSSSSALLLLNLKGKILRVNRKALEVSDLPLTANVTEFNIWDPPWWNQDLNSQKIIKSDLEQVLSGCTITRQIELRNSSDELLTHKISFSPIYFKDNLSYIYVEGIDITEQIQVQNKLLQNESRFKELSDTAGECRWEIDANGIFQKLDKRSQIVKGYPVAELIGHHFTKTMPAEDREKFESNFEKAKLSRVPFQVDLRTQSKDGNLLWEKLTATPIFNSDNYLIGYRGSSVSITEVKSQESLLIKAKEDAEAGTRAKSQFLAIMSHEIRTPMNGVVGMAELLLETKLNKKQKEFASTIVSSGNSLLQLLNDILDLSKIESGKFELERSNFDFHKLIYDTSNLMAASKPKNPVKLIVKVEKDVPQFVVGDSTRLRQVIINLLGNSVKFTTKGKVSIEVSTIKLTQLNVDVEIKVIDTGIGIKENKLEHIFNNFSQADASTTRKYGGTGLGLAVTRQLIELMGGEIRVESHEGEGTTFTISLSYPLAESSNAKEIKQTTKIINGKQMGKNILLVEDNLVNQKIANAILENFGYTVTLALNGNEAVHHCEENKYDAILMDCQMPLMDGYEATVAIRAGLSENTVTPIIAMTANAMQGDKEKCLDVGMNDYLSKPINNLSLKSILERYIG